MFSFVPSTKFYNHFYINPSHFVKFHLNIVVIVIDVVIVSGLIFPIIILIGYYS